MARVFTNADHRVFQSLRRLFRLIRQATALCLLLTGSKMEQAGVRVPAGEFTPPLISAPTTVTVAQKRAVTIGRCPAARQCPRCPAGHETGLWLHCERLPPVTSLWAATTGDYGQWKGCRGRICAQWLPLHHYKSAPGNVQQSRHTLCNQLFPATCLNLSLTLPANLPAGLVYGHITLNTPVLVWSLKLSKVELC